VPKLIIIRGEDTMYEDIKRMIRNSNLKGSELEKDILADNLIEYFDTRLSRIEDKLGYKINLGGENERLDATSPQNALPLSQPVYLLDKQKVHGLFADMNKQERQSLMNSLQD
tara:strand:+ start:204 stop:542 length:339 start_codon:yes stop_codon:yes gene_type:complete